MAVNPFRLVTFITRGILQDLPTIQNFISAHAVQAILIQEINFKGELDELAIDGFTHFCLPSFLSNNIQHRGLLLYIDNRLPVQYLDTVDLPTIQSQSVYITLPHTKVILHNVYIPPDLTVVDYPAFQLATLLSHHSATILTGDLNSHHPTWMGRRHNSGNTLVAISHSLNCTIVAPREPTFVHHDTVLDLVITKGILQHNIQVLREGLSDHWPVLLSTDIVLPVRKPTSISAPTTHPLGCAGQYARSYCPT